MEGLLLLSPKHHVRAFENGGIIQRTDLDNDALRQRCHAASHMNAAPTAKLSSRSCIGTVSAEFARVALRIAKGTRFDANEKVSSSA